MVQSGLRLSGSRFFLLCRLNLGFTAEVEADGEEAEEVDNEGELHRARDIRDKALDGRHEGAADD